MMTQEQSDAIDKIFAENFNATDFMQPSIEGPQTWFVVESNNGESFVVHEMGQSDLGGGHEFGDDLSFGQIDLKKGEYTVTERVCYGAQLQASGYMDQTDWILGDDPVKLAQDLADMYGEDQGCEVEGCHDFKALYSNYCEAHDEIDKESQTA